ncbi:hypothetical protein [Nocardia flavorosea]|uniref:Uncharacterized protein n=1 Tax=Nocardia flavorosea TaxID=53429 RepID=A0A846YH45_9NOCA|nr:hypothetical protein [Nocardia flavorosea]NKY57004.1 hypothetical protein [Nocardia flavorosea]
MTTLDRPATILGTAGRDAAIPPAVVVAAPVVAALATVAAATGIGGPLRVVAVLAMVSCAPGLPVVALLRLPHRGVSFALGLSASWATWLLLSLWQVTVGWWAPVACAGVVTGISAVAAGWAVRDAAAAGTGRASAGTGPVSARHTAPAGRGAAQGVRRVVSGHIASHGGDRWRWVAFAALLFAVAMGWWETRIIDLDAAGPYGLIGVVSWRIFVALAAVAVAFALAVGRRRVDSPVAAGAAALLVCLLYQLVSVADGSPVVSTAFVHIGFIDYIGTAHQLPPSLDARFSWSGFFDAAAVLVELSGLDDAAPLLLWAPAVFTALAALPVFTIARLITGSRRAAWIALVIYICGNWFQQDYFSPQALVFVMHFSVVATLLWLLRSSPVPRVEGALWQRLSALPVRVPGLPPSVPRRRALLLEGVLFFIVAATVVSHQLTPVLTIATCTLLAGVGALRQRWLPVAAGIVFLAWLSYGAPDYWTGHLHVILGDFGRVGDSLQTGLGDRFSGAQTYQRMQWVRVAWTGAIMGLAAAGWWLNRRAKCAPAVGVLLIAPFLLVVGQSYGGEIVLRCCFYALPVAAPLAALALVRIHRIVRPALRWRGASVVALSAVVGVCAVLGVTARGLNTAFERNPADLVGAARRLLDTVPNGTALLPPNGEGVLKMGRLTTVVWPQGGVCSVWTVECVETFDADYILLSTSQQAALELQWGTPHGWLYEFGDQLVARGLYRVVERTPHALVLARTSGR